MSCLAREVRRIKTEMAHSPLVALARRGIENNLRHLLTAQGNINPAIERNLFF